MTLGSGTTPFGVFINIWREQAARTGCFFFLRSDVNYRNKTRINRYKNVGNSSPSELVYRVPCALWKGVYACVDVYICMSVSVCV